MSIWKIVRTKLNTKMCNITEINAETNNKITLILIVAIIRITGDNK